MIVTKSIKDFILSNFNQELLFAKYFKINIFQVQQCITTNHKVKNNLRDDQVASLSFFYHNDKLKMWDYGNFMFRGDIFDLVGILIGKNPNDTNGFIYICKFIILDNKVSEVAPITNTNVERMSILSYVKRGFTKFDLEYWKYGNVSKAHLINRGVSVAKTARYNGKIFYEEVYHDPLFVYNLGIDNNEDLIKTYRPLIKDNKFKFKTNNSYSIEGFEELYESDILIITKSRKDKLVLESYIDNGIIVNKITKLIKSLNIPSFIDYPYINATYSNHYAIDYKYCITNLMAESILLSESIVELLKSKHKEIIINYDYDLTGITNAFFYYLLYGFKPMFIGRSHIPIINNITDKLLSIIIAKFNTFNLTITKEQFIDFIKLHSGENESKDWYELSKLNKNKCKTLIDEFYKS
jgi:hypothetical protein